MEQDHELRDELIEQHDRESDKNKAGLPTYDKLDDEFFVFTLTVKQRKRIIDIIIKIAIGIVLVIVGYFLPH